MLVTRKNLRAKRDFYPTPEPFTHTLMRNWRPNVETIWEPAAGDGAMSSVLRSYGYTVVESDISTGDDFLFTDTTRGEAIITNPPFSLTTDFATHAVSMCDRVALLLGVHFLGGSDRCNRLWKRYPPSLIVVIPQRMRVETSAGVDNSQFNHMWVVWDAEITGQSITWENL